MDLTEAVASTRAGNRHPPAEEVSDRPGVRWLTVATGFLLVVAVVVRFVTVSALWLDEAQTVNIARLPLGDLAEGLRHDGAPPLFYVLLHGWMRIFGDGDLSVRFLPGLFGVAALPLAWIAGRRLGGRTVAWSAVILLAASPFAVRYATEARMYSMLVVLVLVGYLAVMELLEQPGSRRAAIGVGLVTGSLLLTHYWALYLLFVTGVTLVVLARRAPSPTREGARRGLVAMAVGSLAFVPWVPSFLYQLTHTGAPWGAPGRLRSMVDTVFHFSGGYWDPGLLVGMVTYALIALAIFGRAVDGRRIEIDLRSRPGGRHLAVVGFGTLAVAVLATVIARSAFAVRYASVMFPMIILLAALGTARLLDRRVRHAVLAGVVVCGLWATAPNVFGDRTSAARVAAALEKGVQPGDVVAYCPDQLGPSVSRLLPDDGLGAQHLTFPRATPPQLVDWVDYAKVNKAADPAPFAQMLLDRAGSTGTVWVVWAPGYKTFKDKCQGVLGNLDLVRRNNTRPVKLPSKNFEKPALIRFPPQ
ncbi:MAG TPA: glycosyltransferase family 39 protein [Acidimicrobiales bacterium]|nr:glycosyltransferase family 39 protein [Acidimicrobiales bacterium]